MTVKKLDSGLHILATPIGTANDITIRALNILRDADILVATKMSASLKIFKARIVISFAVPIGVANI